MGRSRSTRGERGAPAPRVPASGWPAWSDPRATQRLQEGPRSGQIAHAYLLSGPEGVGKADLARAFAQAICCTATDREDPALPCGECRACRNVLRAAHPDVETIDLAAQAALAERPGRGMNLGIDAVRRLSASAALLPLEAERRILIIDDAETMLEPAQQALLKTLEEPPPFVTLLLLSDEAEAMLTTVRSRCREIVVRPMPERVILESLTRLGVEEELAAEVARLSRGCGAWAQSAASDSKRLQARRDEWEQARTWAASPEYDRLVTAYRLGEQYNKRREVVVGVVQAAIQVLRLAMLRAAGVAGPEAVEPDTREAPDSALAIGRAIDASLQCLRDLDANVRPRLALEAMVLAWPNPKFLTR